MSNINGNVFSYIVEGDSIPARRIVKYGTSDDKRSLATNATNLAGITTDVGQSEAGQRVDVQEDGECLLQLGTAVSAGAWLTCGVGGRGVVAAAGQEVVARAKESGISDEIIRVNITRFVKL